MSDKRPTITLAVAVLALLLCAGSSDAAPGAGSRNGQPAVVQHSLVGEALERFEELLANLAERLGWGIRGTEAADKEDPPQGGGGGTGGGGGGGGTGGSWDPSGRP